MIVNLLLSTELSLSDAGITRNSKDISGIVEGHHMVRVLGETASRRQLLIHRKVY